MRRPVDHVTAHLGVAVALAIGLSALAWPGSAAAQDPLEAPEKPDHEPLRYDLTLYRLPSPTSLSMRSSVAGASERVAQVDPAQASPNRRSDIVRRRLSQWLAPRPASNRVSLQDALVFRFNLGFGIDGGDPESDPTLLSGLQLSQPEYAALRIYYFGDAIIGSQGLFSPSLSTYVASQFRFDQGERDCDVLSLGGCANAIPSVQDNADASNIRIRSGYGQADGFFDNPLLAPVFIRAGRQYRYGPAIAHFDGLTMGYDTPTVSVGAFIGSGVDLHGFSVDDEVPRSSALFGFDARVAIYERWRVPLVWSASMLRFDDRTHLQGDLALQWNQDIAIRTSLRALDDRVARTSLQVRARVSEVTTINLEAESRNSSDWMYDLFTIDRPQSEEDPRQYLDLGVPVPRVYATLRAGTVLFDNIDVLVRGGAAFERGASDAPSNPHATNFLEGGGAIEVRPRRAVALGLSGLIRRFRRDGSQFDGENTPLFPDPLPTDFSQFGERSFAEGGMTARYTQGARRLTARVEVYTRYFNTPAAYQDVMPLDDDVRIGGRFGAEIWPSDQLRLKVDYEVSSQLVLAPEVRGFKSLRAIAEGRF